VGPWLDVANSERVLKQRATASKIYLGAAAWFHQNPDPKPSGEKPKKGLYLQSTTIAASL
jgi:hypothetical protein